MFIIFWSKVEDWLKNQLLGLLLNFQGYIKPVAQTAKFLENLAFYLPNKFINEAKQKKMVLSDDAHTPESRRRKILAIKLDNVLFAQTNPDGGSKNVKFRNESLKFINEMEQIYQVVFFSDLPSPKAAPAFAYLDPTVLLYRPRQIFGSEHFSTKKNEEGGGDVGTQLQIDLKSLNKGLDNIVVLDCSKAAYENQEGNVVLIPKFDGKSEDKDLEKVSLLLKRKFWWVMDFIDLGDKTVKDVRTELSKLGPEAQYEVFYNSWKEEQNPSK